MLVRLIVPFVCIAVIATHGIAQEQSIEQLFDVGEIETPEGDSSDVAQFLTELVELEGRMDSEYRKLYGAYRNAKTKVASAKSRTATRLLDDADIPDEVFKVAARYGLPSRLRTIASQPRAEKERLLGLVARQLKLSNGQNDRRSELSGASSLVSYLERGGDYEFAIQACESFSKVLEQATDPSGKAMVSRFDGIARRLGLLGNSIELTGTLIDGSQFDWSDYEGKVVLVDFWATWCGPCIAEAPNVLANYEKYHDRGFDVVGISLDTKKSSLENYVTSKKVPWVNLFENGKGWQHPMAVKYGVTAIPTVFLVDRDGTVISLRARGDELGKQLKRLLETKEDVEREVAAITKQLESGSDDASLFEQRATLHLQLKDYAASVSDYRKAVEIDAKWVNKAFFKLRGAEQWESAAEFGWQKIEQKPEDIMRWLTLAPVLVKCADPELYRMFCEKFVEQKKKSTEWRECRILCKSCLLRPDAISTDLLPQQAVAEGFTQGDHDAVQLAWAWSVMAILALRNDDAKQALECLDKSEKQSPPEYAKSLNKSLYAIAYHKLGKKDTANQFLQDSTAYFDQMRARNAVKYHHDILIAELLLQEARTLVSNN